MRRQSVSATDRRGRPSSSMGAETAVCSLEPFLVPKRSGRAAASGLAKFYGFINISQVGRRVGVALDGTAGGRNHAGLASARRFQVLQSQERILTVEDNEAVLKAAVTATCGDEVLRFLRDDPLAVSTAWPLKRTSPSLRLCGGPCCGRLDKLDRRNWISVLRYAAERLSI
jgi:hypothetical protein